MRQRSTIRWRLTAVYGALFLLSGIVLLTISFKFVTDSLRESETNSKQQVIDKYRFPTDNVEFFYNLQVPRSPTRPEAKTVGDVIEGIQGDIRADTTHTLLVGSGVALLVMLVASVGLGWLASGRALRPVDDLTAKAKRLSEDNLHERLDYQGPQDELKELADTLDGMLERLSRAFDAQRNFAASVSHELRTPLAVLQAEAALTLGDSAASPDARRLAATVDREVTKATALLESLLTLARTESTMHDHERVDLADLTGDVVGERVASAEKVQVHVDLELGPDPVVVEGDPWLLERLVANLVDNAITHNHRGGWATISVTTDEQEHAVIRVSNTGDVVDEAQVERLTEPFQRADRDRPGYGLGMSIMRAVTEAHGGQLDVRPHEGGGLDVAVTLPGVRVPAGV